MWILVLRRGETLGLKSVVVFGGLSSGRTSYVEHDSGGELEQIQFLPGHVSVQTTEKYLVQRLVSFQELG
jgi:hypothetical protein